MKSFILNIVKKIIMFVGLEKKKIDEKPKEVKVHVFRVSVERKDEDKKNDQ